MIKIWNNIKKHWGVSSNFQVIIILVVFSVTGFSTMYSHKFINYILGINTQTDFWIKAIVFILIILPLWSLLFFLWGTLLGQKQFVVKFLQTKIKLLSLIFKKPQVSKKQNID